jgi:hypothetical protein
MKLKYALVGLIGTVGSASAFRPATKPFGLDRYKIGQTDNIEPSSVSSSSLVTGVKDPTQHPALWRPPMKMVAGGEERAYGNDYYDGKMKTSKVDKNIYNSSVLFVALIQKVSFFQP